MELKNIHRWSFFVFLIVVTILFFNKGMDLRSSITHVDGDAIGVYFLIFEIDDWVPKKSIPTYSNGFFVASIITALVAIFEARKNTLRYRAYKTEV